ncbi:MAG: hypothetical protein KY475_15675 [Planctomycetes bacterium]|nr:hypothetical protein [Planctomycetota bacterium]
MTLSGVEFLRRFFTHLLPKSFVHIRSCWATAVWPFSFPETVWPNIGTAPSSSTTVHKPAWISFTSLGASLIGRPAVMCAGGN